MSDAAEPAQAKAKRERAGWFAELRRAIDGPLLWLGVFVGAVSGISAIARLFHVGLSGVFHDFVQFYRALLRPIYELINLPPWPFHVPELAVDLFAVYAVLVGMGLRSAMGKPRVRYSGRPLHSLLGLFRRIARCLLLTPVLLFEPCTDYLMFADPKRRKVQVRFWGSDPQIEDKMLRFIINRLRQDMLAFISVPAAIIIFFVLNAYAPGSG